MGGKRDTRSTRLSREARRKRARLLLNQSPNRPIAVLVSAGTGSVVGNGYRSDCSGRARSTGCRERNSLGDVLRDGQV